MGLVGLMDADKKVKKRIRVKEFKKKFSLVLFQRRTKKTWVKSGI